MSQANPSSTIPRSKFVVSQQIAPDPSITPFDDADDEDEWWEDEESPVREPEYSRSGSRTTQWPAPAGQGTGSTIKPAQREVRKHVRAYSVWKPIREKSKHRQKKQNAAAGIKVNTDFSRHYGPPPVVQPPTITAKAPADLQPGCFVDLAALNALDNQGSRVNDGLWKTVKRLMPNKNNQTGPNNETMAEGSPTVGAVDSNSQLLSVGRLGSRRGQGRLPAPLKLEADLSPADRPIVIGISIPSARLAQHATSPQTAVSDTATVMQSANTLSPDYPETPAIIITPSQEPSTWSRSRGTDAVSASRHRAASSVYSHGTVHSSQDQPYSVVPPVPQIPTSTFPAIGASRSKKQKSVRLSAATVFSEDEEDRRSRFVSTYTVFEEDESPILARIGRARSVSAANSAFQHTSVNQELDQRESTGWWNHILTPFLSRSSTVVSPRSATQERPAVPSLADATLKGQGTTWDINNWEKRISPVSPLSSTTIASDVWWDNRNTLTGSNKGTGQRESIASPDAEEGTLPFMLVAGDLDVMQEQGRNNEVSLVTRPTDGTESMPESATRLERELSDHSNAPHSTAFVPVTQPPANIIRNPLPRLRAVQNAPNTDSPLPQPIDESRFQTPATRNIDVQSESQTALHEEPQPPPYSPPRLEIPRYRAVLPPGHLNNLREPPSPTPLSPGLQQAMSSTGAIPLSEIPLTPAPRRAINLNSGYPGLPARPRGALANAASFGEPSKKSQKLEARRQRYEKEDALAHKAGGLWRGRGCIPDRGCYGRGGPEGRKRRRWYFGLCAAILAITILVVILAMTLHKSTPIMEQPHSQWLNLTTFPPIFTGVSTVAYPENTLAMSGCADPSTSWSCSLPPDLRQSTDPNLANRPSFRMEIQWDTSNSTAITPSEADTSISGSKRSLVGNPVSAGHVAKRLLLKARDAIKFVPNPSLPSELEQFFLGNTTDNITSSNKSGERTPFYISFLSTSEVLAVQKRDASEHDVIRRQNSSSDPFPDIVPLLNSYFPPDVDPDLTPAAANLVPFPTQQRLRLFDRGLESEHYGFYTYFNRSIFLEDLPAAGSPNIGNPTGNDDENGGVKKSDASYRCTWSETRFLVQMWTRKGPLAQLLGSRGFNASTPTRNETANNFQQPGSFPYPMTITTDRHGGMAERKEAYCYGIVNGNFNSSDARLLQEKKASGGTIISPAPGLVEIGSGTLHSAFGGFDGGTGGCSCQWANWQARS